MHLQMLYRHFSSAVQVMLQEQIQEWYVQAFAVIESGTTGAIALADEPEAAEAVLSEEAETPQDSHRKQHKVAPPSNTRRCFVLPVELLRDRILRVCSPRPRDATMFAGSMDVQCQDVMPVAWPACKESMIYAG